MNREKKQGLLNLDKPCRICTDCNGRGCVSEIPGMGGAGQNEAFIANIESFRCMNDPGISSKVNYKIFDYSIETPILCAPITGADENLHGAISEKMLAITLSEGAVSAGSLYFAGDGFEDFKHKFGIEAGKSSGHPYGVIFKPYKRKKLLERAALNLDGAIMAGIDVDSVRLSTMTRKNAELDVPDANLLREFSLRTGLPLVIKGVASSEQLELALNAEADVLVLGNHGGRVDQNAPGTADILRELIPQIPNHILIIAEGGIRTSSDVRKALFLGANLVMTGRPLIIAAVTGGADKVATVLRDMHPEKSEIYG